MKLRRKDLAALAAVLSVTVFLCLPALAGAAPSLYVVNAGSNVVSQFGLDLAGFPSPLSPPYVGALEGPEQIALSPDGTSAYVTAQMDDKVAQYDIDPTTGALTKKSPASVLAWDAPVAIALTPDGRSAYVASSANDNVIQYDVDPLDGTLEEKSPTSRVATGGLPRDLAVSPDGASLYVADQESDQISQDDIDPEDGSLSPKATPTVATGETPFAIAVSPDGASLYAADKGSDQVSQYDIDPGDGTLTPKAVATVPTGSEPDAIAVNPDGKNAYVINEGSASISQYGIDPVDGSLALKATTPTGALPIEIAFSPDGTRAYVSNWTGYGLLVYSVHPATGSLSSVGGVNTYSAPTGIATLADTTGPTVTIDSGPSGTVVDSDAAFTFSANEPDSTFACSLGAASFQPCSSPQAYSGLGDGKHLFTVRATDPWGNVGPPAQQTWTIDATGPTVTIDSGPSGTVAGSDATFTFSASEPGSTFECSLGAGFSACSSPVAYAGLGDGSHVFTVRATDPLGNRGAPVQRRWSVRKAVRGPNRPGSPPARPSHPQSPTVAPPSKPLSLGKLRRDRRMGTARLVVRVDGPGKVRLVGTRSVRGVHKHVRGPGRISLRVAPKRNARQQLRERGRLRVSLRVVYLRSGGGRSVESRRATLIMRRR